MTKKSGLNGDSKILLAKIEERLDNQKEYIKEEFDEIKKIQTKVVKRLYSHGKKISSLRTYAKLGAGVVLFMAGVIAQHLMVGV